MKQLQEFRVTLERGKQKTKDQVGEAKKVVDSAAEYLLIESETALARETENSKNKATPIRIFNIWEDVSEPEAKPKAQKPKSK